MATLESLVSPDRFRGKIDLVIDFTFVRERVADLYRPDNGRPALARDKVHDASPRGKSGIVAGARGPGRGIPDGLRHLDRPNRVRESFRPGRSRRRSQRGPCPYK